MNSDFWNKLKELYIEEDGVDENFIKEEKALNQIFKKLYEKLNSHYDFRRPLGRGGAGIVVELWEKNLEVSRALKIPRL